MWPPANVRNQMTVYIIWLHEIPLKKYLYIYEWPNTVYCLSLSSVHLKYFIFPAHNKEKKYFYCYMQDFILQSKTYFKERTFVY